MPINVILPQMGEAILEGTVTKWLKKIGERVKRDESLLEVSTDKVDTEVPSPAEGVLTQILVKEGETVQVNTVIAILEAVPETTIAPVVTPQAVPEAAAEAIAVPEAGSEAVIEPAMTPEPAIDSATIPEAAPGAGLVVPRKGDVEREATAVPVDSVVDDVGVAVPAAEVVKSDTTVGVSVGGSAFVLASPLVRRISRDHGLDLSEIRGTGLSGRIRKEDILRHLAARQGTAASPEAVSPPAVAKPDEPVAASVSAMPRAEEAPSVRPAESVAVPAAPAPELVSSPPATPAEVSKSDEGSEIIMMSPMRKVIAEHMVLSKHTSAHVQTVFEVDMTAIVRLRERQADQFEARTGISLTYTPFFVKALIEVVRDFPILNSSVSGDKILLKKAVNVGIAVALDTGLIVPVVMNAQLKSFPELALGIHDLAKRARTKRLRPEEVQHGTITVTNPGIFGSLFGMPIINQPQVAILCVGSLEKRPVVINDAIAIRTMAYLVLSFDHRIIDGAVADQAMSKLKTKLQSWNTWRD